MRYECANIDGICYSDIGSFFANISETKVDRSLHVWQKVVQCVATYFKLIEIGEAVAFLQVHRK